MPSTHLTHASTRAIVRPRCPKCNAVMMLARIEPDRPGHFECPVCDYAASEVVHFN
jgi:Zn ribbon nucleic-acid-binding protein